MSKNKKKLNIFILNRYIILYIYVYSLLSLSLKFSLDNINLVKELVDVKLVYFFNQYFLDFSHAKVNYDLFSDQYY